RGVLAPVLLLMPPRPPRPTLFPYTTLFRSKKAVVYNKAVARNRRFPLKSEASIRLALIQLNMIRTGLKLWLCHRPVADSLHVVIDRKSTRLNSSHVKISYAVFCLKKKKKQG